MKKLNHLVVVFFLMVAIVGQSLFLSSSVLADTTETTKDASTEATKEEPVEAVIEDQQVVKATTSSALVISGNIEGQLSKNDTQKVSITWNPVDNAEGYHIYKKSATDASYIKVTTDALETTHYVLGLEKNQDVLLAVSALSSEQETGYYLGHIICDENGRLHEVISEDDFSSSAKTDDLWNIHSGNWAVTGGTFNHLDNSVEGIVSTGDLNWTDYTAEISFNTGNGGGFPGLIGRFQDTSNFYYFQMHRTGNLAFTIRKDGSSKEQKIGYSMKKNTWYTLRMAFSGSSIKCYIVDQGVTNLVFDITDATLANGKVAVRNKWQPISMDHMKVYTPLTWQNDTTLLSSELTDQSVKLSWQPVNGAESYNLYRIQGSKEVLVYEGSDTTYEDHGLSTGTEYVYYMTYKREGETSLSSHKLAVTTILVAPQKPTNIQSYVFKNAIRLVWDEVEGAKGYIVYRRNGTESWDDDWYGYEDNGHHWGQRNHQRHNHDYSWWTSEEDDWVEVYNGEKADYLNLELQEGTSYEYKILAYNDAGNSPETDILSLTTKISEEKTVTISDAFYTNWGRTVVITGETDLENVNIKVYHEASKELVYMSSEYTWFHYHFSTMFRLGDSAKEGKYIIVAGNSDYYTTSSFEVVYNSEDCFEIENYVEDFQGFDAFEMH